MTSIGVMTFLHNDNYGSALQAYALQRVIREAGYECEHIDFQPDRNEKIRNLLQSGNSPKLILEGIRKRVVRAGQVGARQKSEAIPDFYQRRMKLTHRCRNMRELNTISKKYDILLCGSDQIWNPVWLNPAYFLTFAEKEARRIAYAASLGVSELPKADKIRKIRRWTEGFEAISVREEEGAELMQEMTGKRPEVMPDPVCLLSAEEWNEIAEKPPEGQPYLLCYFIGENTGYWARVRQLQQETGLRVLVMPVTAESYRSGYELLDGAGPEGFLGAVQDAACFCTDSFHGLAFGTIFGVGTELLRRYSDSDPESKNSRVDHFLRLANKKGTEAIRQQGRSWLKSHLE